MKSVHPSISVVIPARNEEASIGDALDSVLSQDYPGSVEVIVADGSDTPATSKVVAERFPSVRILPNPQRFLAPGVNAACKVATGDVIVRCDARTTLSPGYLRRAVEILQRTDAGIVGGRQRPVGVTFFERAAAMGMSTPLGAGGARYRLGGAEGPVETFILGVLWRQTWDAARGYDASLPCAEDYELNWRLRQQGKTIWFDPALVATYRPRPTLRKLAQQYYRYGRWKRVVLRMHPRAALPRHFAVPLLLLGLAGSALLAGTGAPALAAAALPVVYVSSLIAGSLVVGLRRGDSAALALPLVLATMHFSWGAGFLTPGPARRPPTGSVVGAGALGGTGKKKPTAQLRCMAASTRGSRTADHSRRRSPTIDDPTTNVPT